MEGEVPAPTGPRLMPPGIPEEAKKLMKEMSGAIVDPEIRPSATPPHRPPMRTNIQVPPLDSVVLGPVEGSEIHILQLEIRTLEAEFRALEIQMSMIKEDGDKKRKELAALAKKYNLPDGCKIDRQKDGTYIFKPPEHRK